MEAIDKYKLLAALVRGFFEAYASGIIDCHVKEPAEKYRPQTIKRVMLEHYEHIADAFHNTLFYPIATLNFTYKEVKAIVVEKGKEKASMYELIKRVCATEEMYQAMVEEYKRNFGLLLSGHYSSLQDHLQNYTRQSGKAETVDTERGIRLVVRTVMTAYAKGIRAGGTGKASLHQPTVFRLILDSVPALVYDQPASKDTAKEQSDLGGLFLKACRTKRNMDITIDEMEQTYGELVKHEGIVAHDDRAN